MTRHWPTGEPVTMQVDKQGRPHRFIWQGRSHRLQQIQQRWQVDSDWWSEDGRIWRNYFAVITSSGLFCVLYFDLLEQGWYVAKVYD